MAVIKTDNPIDISAGHCHGPTIPMPSQKSVRINGNGVMVCGQSGYSYASCGDNNHVRLCSILSTHPNVRINYIPVFTSDDFILCGESAGIGIFPVFVN